MDRPTLDDWRRQVEKDLAGADFERKLVWRTEDGLPVQPLYTEAPALPGELLHNQDPWEVRESHTPAPFHEQGASPVQELALTLAQALETMRATGEPPAELHLSVSTSLYLEIAKVRAARLLWARIAQLADLAPRLPIHLSSSTRDKSSLDRHTNLIRTAVESLVAAVAGCDSLALLPFEDSDFGRRLARNQQLLLLEEAELYRVADAPAGSYLLDSLTDQMARAAWTLLQRLEEGGGLQACLKEGWPQREMEAMDQRRRQALAQGRTGLVGVSRYADASQKTHGPTSKGLAQPFEVLRERARRLEERTDAPPRAVLLALGAAGPRRARAAFSSSFLAVGGFEVIDHPGFATPEEAARHAEESQAEVVVLCSSDQEYADLVSALKPLLKDRALVVAGFPEDADRLREAGVAGFVHLKSDRLATLHELLDAVEARRGVRS